MRPLGYVSPTRFAMASSLTLSSGQSADTLHYSFANRPPCLGNFHGTQYTKWVCVVEVNPITHSTMNKYITLLFLAPFFASAQCGHQFITQDQSWSYDAEIKYFEFNGALDTVYYFQKTDFLLLPICETKRDYIATFTENGHLVDMFITMHDSTGTPQITHTGMERVRLVQHDY